MTIFKMLNASMARMIKICVTVLITLSVLITTGVSTANCSSGDDFGLVSYDAANLSQLGSVAIPLLSGKNTGNMSTYASTDPVVRTWNSRRGNLVTLRRSVEEKIASKHNLNYRAVKSNVLYGNEKNTTGTRWEYRIPVMHVHCSGALWWRKYSTTETITVLSVVDYRTYHDGKPYGVVTTYCYNYAERCPDWVRDSRNWVD